MAWLFHILEQCEHGIRYALDMVGYGNSFLPRDGNCQKFSGFSGFLWYILLDTISHMLKNVFFQFLMSH